MDFALSCAISFVKIKQEMIKILRPKGAKHSKSKVVLLQFFRIFALLISYNGCVVTNKQTCKTKQQQQQQ